MPVESPPPPSKPGSEIYKECDVYVCVCVCVCVCGCVCVSVCGVTMLSDAHDNVLS